MTESTVVLVLTPGVCKTSTQLAAQGVGVRSSVWVEVAGPRLAQLRFRSRGCSFWIFAVFAFRAWGVCCEGLKAFELWLLWEF